MTRAAFLSLLCIPAFARARWRRHGSDWIYTNESGRLWLAVVRYGRQYQWHCLAWGDHAESRYISLNNETREQAMRAAELYFKRKPHTR